MNGETEAPTFRLLTKPGTECPCAGLCQSAALLPRLTNGFLITSLNHPPTLGHVGSGPGGGPGLGHGALGPRAALNNLYQVIRPLFGPISPPAVPSSYLICS